MQTYISVCVAVANPRIDEGTGVLPHREVSHTVEEKDSYAQGIQWLLNFAFLLSTIGETV